MSINNSKAIFGIQTNLTIEHNFNTYNSETISNSHLYVDFPIDSHPCLAYLFSKWSFYPLPYPISPTRSFYYPDSRTYRIKPDPSGFHSINPLRVNVDPFRLLVPRCTWTLSTEYWNKKRNFNKNRRLFGPVSLFFFWAIRWQSFDFICFEIYSVFSDDF